MILTQAAPAHFAQILALNEGSVHFLSPLSPQRLEQLHRQAAYHKLVLEGDRVAAFWLFAAGHSGGGQQVGLTAGRARCAGADPLRAKGCH